MSSSRRLNCKCVIEITLTFDSKLTVMFLFLGENAYLTPSGNRPYTPQTSLVTPSSAIKAHIMDLEGPSYSLKSLFHLPGATKVRFTTNLTALQVFQTDYVTIYVTSSKFTTKPPLYKIPCKALTTSLFFLSGYFFQLCFFENTGMRLSQVYTQKQCLGVKFAGLP